MANTPGQEEHHGRPADSATHQRTRRRGASAAQRPHQRRAERGRAGANGAAGVDAGPVLGPPAAASRPSARRRVTRGSRSAPARSRRALPAIVVPGRYVLTRLAAVRWTRVLLLLDADERHPALRVHALAGDLAVTWATSSMPRGYYGEARRL